MYCSNPKTHHVQTINISDTELIRKERQIIPLYFEGGRRTLKEATELYLGKSGKRDQVNGLVYGKSQLPVNGNNRKWRHVLRRPSAKKNTPIPASKF